MYDPHPNEHDVRRQRDGPALSRRSGAALLLLVVIAIIVAGYLL
ncbi:MAG TPA: hypothetical protein VHI55_09555 [Gaiellaceae bacterium]|nr:hypothetical protein [Gaiellaceae bacterium]